MRKQLREFSNLCHLIMKSLRSLRWGKWHQSSSTGKDQLFWLCLFSLHLFRKGRNMFYLCLVIYLYGDLAIYGAAVAKSLRDVACTFKPPNMTSPLNISESEVQFVFFWQQRDSEEELNFENFNCCQLKLCCAVNRELQDLPGIYKSFTEDLPKTSPFLVFYFLKTYPRFGVYILKFTQDLP